MIYLAHMGETGQTQTVAEHLEGTQRLAHEFGEAFGAGALAGLSGRMHDQGKYSFAFQKRIRGGALRTDHATAGAQEAFHRFPGLGSLLAYCIAGHHGGLPAGGTTTDTEAESTLLGRMKRSVEACEAYFNENTLPDRLPAFHPPTPFGKGGFTLSFFTRMLYSCLVDADFLDTEAFMSGGAIQRGGFDSLHTLNQKLDAKLSQFGDSARAIDQKRCEILANCIAAAASRRGLFSLTVPTGGGKTISSLAFALKHALRNDMQRVIYVVPYMSIIEQNAAVFADILGAENVLQHHSNFDFSGDDDGVLYRQKLATENWDMPLIVTTCVQFFESLFAFKPSRCRKLHNIANSVIIFDEAQMLPTEYLTPCIHAIAELVQNYRCTAVLCSATQPALTFPAPLSVREICRAPQELSQFFRRVRIVDRGKLSNESLLSELREMPQVLCIVNTRRHASALHQELSNDAFHLSTRMCPQHRRAVITEIRRRLAVGEPCRVVSTQLIEAGVDVDFPVVYRALAGVDSLVQSAGRCNREGRVPMREVYVFEPDDKKFARLPHLLGRPAAIAKGLLCHHADLLSPEAIHAYFTELYQLEGPHGTDIKGILSALESTMECRRTPFVSFDFPKIAESFQLIESETRTALIPYDAQGRERMETLRKQGPDRKLLRALQPYTVPLEPWEFESLINAGTLEYRWEIGFLVDESCYSERGLAMTAKSGQAIFF